MNYERRKMRPRQPSIPSAPNKGLMGSGMSSGVAHKGTVGNGTMQDNCKGAQGSMTSRSQKGY